MFFDLGYSCVSLMPLIINVVGGGVTADSVNESTLQPWTYDLSPQEN